MPFHGNEQPSERITRLARIPHRFCNAGWYGGTQIGVVKDDIGGLAPEFQPDSLDAGIGASKHRYARTSETGNGHHVGPWMGDQVVTDLVTTAMEQDKDSGWRAHAVHDFSESDLRRRRQFARLDHDGAICGQRGSDFGGDLIHRPVPGRPCRSRSP